MKTLPAPRGIPRRFESSTWLTLLFLLLAFVSPISAQAPAAPGAETTGESSDDVVVLSPFEVLAESVDRYRVSDAVSAVRIRSALIDTPSTISVITREMMDDLAPNRVFDAVRYVAGVQEGRGINFQDRMIIRGFETQAGARTVDNFLQSADADVVEEALIERIEVTKGPNAILSPAGAPGGSLNVITKSPSFTAKRSLALTLGMFDAQKAVLDMSGPLSIGGGDTVAYRLVGSFQDSRRYWSKDAKLKGWAIAPMFTWRISDRSQLTVKFIAADHWIFRDPLFIVSPDTTAATKDPQLLSAIDPSSLNGIQPWSHVGTESQDLIAVFTTRLNEHLDLRVAANGRRYHEDSDQQFPSAPNFSNRYNPATGELTQNQTWALQNTALPYNATTNPYVPTFSLWVDPTNISNRGNIQDTLRKTANVQVDLAGKYQFGAVSSQTVVGAAYSRQYSYSRNKDGTMPAINIFNHVSVYPVYPATYPTNNSGSGTSYSNKLLYLSQRFGLFDDRLYVSGGFMNYSTVSRRWNADTGALSGLLDDDQDVWSVGVLYKVNPNVSIYGSHSTNANAAIPGLNLQPLWQQGEQDEFGIKTEFLDKRLSINAAYFEISQTNVTVPNPAYQTDPTQPQTLVSDLSNKGYEVELMGRLTDNLSAIATFSHLNMRDALGRMVRAVADNNASLLLNYSFTDGPADGLTLNFGLSYSGKRAGDSPTDGGNFTQLGVVKKTSFFLKPQYLTTFGASYRVNEKLSFRLNVDNIFDDADYISVAGGRITGTGIYTQPGINVRLTTTFNF
jgi:iron complex outermembrane receptor protein